MKRIISLFLVFVICLSMCACENSAKNNDKGKIESALKAAWINDTQLPDSPYTVSMVYIFDDGVASGGVDVFLGEGENLTVTRAYGSYEILDEEIVINWTSIDNQIKDIPLLPDSKLPYVYENDILELYSRDGNSKLVRQDIGIN